MSIWNVYAEKAFKVGGKQHHTVRDGRVELVVLLAALLVPNDPDLVNEVSVQEAVELAEGLVLIVQGNAAREVELRDEES